MLDNAVLLWYTNLENKAEQHETFSPMGVYFYCIGQYFKME